MRKLFQNNSRNRLTSKPKRAILQSDLKRTGAERPNTTGESTMNTVHSIDIGYMDKEEADALHAKLDGKTYMKFEIIRAPSPGGTHVSAASLYKSFLMNVCA